MTIVIDLRNYALGCLIETDPRAKCALIHPSIVSSYTIRPELTLRLSDDIPGRPSKPELVSPKLVAQRGLSTPEGRAILLHALTHIEFNAINLALDVIVRFPNMPIKFYIDWWTVACEEAHHFSLLSQHLTEYGYCYGDFPAHNGLWEMAERTRNDLLARIALVPRTLEARGLDVSPGIRDKLAQAGDYRAAEIMQIILNDEIGHVRIGNEWYNYLCNTHQCEPISTYRLLAKKYRAPALKGPLNHEARLAAGFTIDELEFLLEA